jgi:hypothetical protein
MSLSFIKAWRNDKWFKSHPWYNKRVLIWRFTLVLIKINYGQIGDQTGLLYTTNPVFYTSENRFVRRTGTFGNLWFFHLSHRTTVIQDLLSDVSFRWYRTNVNVEACIVDLFRKNVFLTVISHRRWGRALVAHTTHTSLSPIWCGFVPSFVSYKKGCTRLAAASDKVYQLLAHGRWFSPGTPASSTTKTGRHDIAEILLTVALSTIYQTILQNDSSLWQKEKSGGTVW